VPHPVKGEAIVVLVCLRHGVVPSEALRESVRATVTEHLGRALRPEAVVFVIDLPRTRNGKILRRVARGAYLGHADLGDLSGLENPAAIDAVRSVGERVKE
jgi:acetyl-CoA synthetase